MVGGGSFRHLPRSRMMNVSFAVCPPQEKSLVAKKDRLLSFNGISLISGEAVSMNLVPGVVEA